jgi:hypothetical protein
MVQKLGASTTTTIQVAGSVAGVAAAFFWGKNWTWRAIYLGTGLSVGFGGPAAYDKFIAS